MPTAPTARRCRPLALLLSLLLALVPFVPQAHAAVVAPLAPPAPMQTRTASAPESASLQALAEAYVLLLEKYAVPLDPSALVAAGHAGLDAALADKGIQAPIYLGVQGDDPTQLFASLRYRIQALAARYGDQLSERDLVAAAIRGMAQFTDDAHTNYVSPEQYAEYLQWRSGAVTYGGIGARMRGPVPTIIEVFPSSPAEQAGLQPGDTIVAVDGRSVDGLRLDEVVDQVRGPAGTTVTLDVQRASSGRVDQLTLVRAEVTVPFVRAQRVGAFGLVQLRGFPEPSVVTEVEQAITRFQAEGVRGIILDLRGNSGGRIDVGSDLLSRFVPEGPIYQAVDRDGHREVVNVRHARPILTVPLVVLIDEGTASMGEVFAAAVKEHAVGHLIGTPTAGAVAASIYVPLSDGSALQLSVEQVYSGGGALLDKVGVAPDETVELDLDALRQGHDTQLDRAVSYLQQLTGAAAAAATGVR
ncbi:MAG TPA: S41 family peptidase [Chloroflexota bacterium]|jgi:carboxyl-terminal processing protease|nr:S41 family peptidase [Chloroflexota bacterium]